MLVAEEAHAQLHVAGGVAVGRQQGAGVASGGDDALERLVDGLLHLGVAGLADQAHRGGEIGRRHVEHVDVVDLEDRIEVLDRLDVLDQRDQRGVVVGDLEVVGHAVALAAREQAAPADRRELRRLDERPGIVRGVDVGTQIAWAPRSRQR